MISFEDHIPELRSKDVLADLWATTNDNAPHCPAIASGCSASSVQEAPIVPRDDVAKRVAMPVGELGSNDVSFELV
jgi:hypothetical protein